MKLLVAVPSDRPSQLVLKTLLWAPRAGFTFRIFANPSVSKKKYQAAIEEANYQQYLDLKYSMIVRGSDPLTYAQKHDFDIVAVVPPNLRRWNDTKESGLMVIEFQKDLADVRNRMAEDPKLHVVDFENGTRVIRVVKL